jgi:hypothetical protein
MIFYAGRSGIWWQISSGTSSLLVIREWLQQAVPRRCCNIEQKFKKEFVNDAVTAGQTNIIALEIPHPGTFSPCGDRPALNVLFSRSNLAVSW